MARKKSQITEYEVEFQYNDTKDAGERLLRAFEMILFKDVGLVHEFEAVGKMPVKESRGDE